ncbi:MAG: hypothetical protein HFI70_08090 [Lachnospiraceae bacterium]|nr:hypothetical protein [Lachnospiraceae bacterium]
MNVVEEIVILLGISLDIFGAMECQGSLVAKIEKKQLAIFSGILAAGQTIALSLGSISALLLCQREIQVQDVFLGQVIAAAIFLCLGLRLLMKAWKNEGIIERREETFDVRLFLRRYVHSVLFTMLTGFAMGFLGTPLAVQLLLVIILTMLAAIIGMYTGYRLGYEHKMKAYAMGGVLLIAGCVDVIVKYVI